MEFIDIKRAYLQAPTSRALYVQLPDEDAEPGKCAKMNKAMYGTRDAAQNWEWTYRSAHEEWGFKVGKSSPCVMYHPTRNVRLVVHGDDSLHWGMRPTSIGIGRYSPSSSRQR